MYLDIKRAVRLPFSGAQSLIALAIGTLLSMPGAWASAHSETSPAWVALLAFVATVLLTGYEIRIIRQQLTDSQSASLPSWTDKPVDMLLDALCVWVGTLVSGLFFLLITGIVTFGAFALIAGGMQTGPGTYGLYAALGGVGMITFLVFMALPMSLYVSMMTAHYAQVDRFGSVFEWKVIWGTVFRRLFATFFTLLVCFICIGIVQAVIAGLFGGSLSAVAFVLTAAVSFIGTVIIGNLTAQNYAIARAKGANSQ